MSEYYCKETHRTPRITGSINDGAIQIIGRSLPEDAKDFYLPFRDWLLELFVSDTRTINVYIELEYFNTATSKIIIDMLLNLEKLKINKTVSVTWAYDEDDVEMEETGHDFVALLGDMVTLKSKPFVPH
jgi:SiaC family regulatory phosphoprotein